jgi:hypothetical protein
VAGQGWAQRDGSGAVGEVPQPHRPTLLAGARVRPSGANATDSTVLGLSSVRGGLSGVGTTYVANSSS